MTYTKDRFAHRNESPINHGVESRMVSGNEGLMYAKRSWRRAIAAGCLAMMMQVASMVATIDLSYYAGTHEQLSEDKKNLSPINGVVYYHRVIRGLYPEQNALGELCRELFHCVQGTGQQLYPTNRKSQAINHLSPALIGKMIATTEQFRATQPGNLDGLKAELQKLVEADADYQASVQQTKHTYDAIMAVAQTTKKESLANITNRIKNEQKRFSDLRTQLLKIQGIKGLPKNCSELNVEKIREWMSVQAVADNDAFRAELAYFEQLTTDNASAKEAIDKAYEDARKAASADNYSPQKLASFIATFVEACAASGLMNTAAATVHAMPATPYYLLQAFVYRKFVSRDDLAAVCLPLGITVSSQKIDPQGEFEMAIFDLLGVSNLPAFDDYRMAQCTIKNHAISFPDCMDNTMRHFFHILAFNPTTKLFDITRLKSIATDQQIDPQLEAYFQQFSTPAEANTPAGHDAWALLVSNRPGLAYVEAFDPATGRAQRGSFYHDEILKNSATFEGRTYQPAPAGALLYELEVSMHNLIVLVNDLLHLKLFDLNDADFVRSTLATAQFIDTYFPRINEKLGTLSNRSSLLTCHNLHTQIISLSTLYWTMKLDCYAHASIVRNSRVNQAAQVSAGAHQLDKLLRVGTDKRSIWFALNRAQRNPAPNFPLISDLARAYYHSIVYHGITNEDIDLLIQSPHLSDKTSDMHAIFMNLFETIERAFELDVFRQVCKKSSFEPFLHIYTKNKIVKLADKPLDEYQMTALMHAYRAQTAQCIINNVSDNPDLLKKILTHQDACKVTPFMYATAQDSPAMVTLILDAAQKVPGLVEKILTHQNAGKVTPFMRAISKDNPAIVALILEKAQKIPGLVEKILTHQDRNGNMPLMRAIFMDSPDIVTPILDAAQKIPDLLHKILTHKASHANAISLEIFMNEEKADALFSGMSPSLFVELYHMLAPKNSQLSCNFKAYAQQPDDRINPAQTMIEKIALDPEASSMILTNRSTFPQEWVAAVEAYQQSQAHKRQRDDRDDARDKNNDDDHDGEPTTKRTRQE